MPRRRKKTTPSYDWSNDPDCISIRSSNQVNASPEEVAEWIEIEKRELRRIAKEQRLEAKREREREEAEFQKWLAKNPNKTRYDWQVALAKARKGNGWCGFGM